MKRSFLFFLSVLPFALFAFSLNPGAPLQVASDSSATTSAIPVVETNASGQILVVWQDGSGDVLGAFSSDQGVTWTADNPIVSSTSQGMPSLAANNTGFLLVWVDSGTNEPFSSFYSTSSKTWSAQTPIDASVTPNVPVLAKATPKGFLVTFSDGSGNGYTNLSTDGITWQSSSSLVFPSSAGYYPSSLSGTGNENLLLVTWADVSGNLYVATSSDGNSWSGWQMPLLSGVVAGNGSSGCFANGEGFVVAYPDSSFNIWSIFSSDGINWTSPSMVTPSMSPMAGCSNSTTFLSGNDAGFVVNWVDNNFTGQAAFSADGKTWNAPVAVTPAANVVGFFYYYGSTSSVSQNTSIFSWSDASNNPYISISSFPYTPTTPPKKNWGLNTSISPNRPGMVLNN